MSDMLILHNRDIVKPFEKNVKRTWVKPHLDYKHGIDRRGEGGQSICPFGLVLFSCSGTFIHTLVEKLYTHLFSDSQTTNLQIEDRERLWTILDHDQIES